MAGCKVIAVYGGVGSGKSEALGILKNKYKAYVIQADKVAHSLYRKHQPGYDAVIRICGKNLVTENPQIDRKLLGQFLAQHPEKLKEINQAIHPMVYIKTRQLIENYKKNHKRGLIIYEAALLPKERPDYIDEVWYIKSDEKIRRERLRKFRGYDDRKIDSIIKNQPSEADFENASDRIILNNENLKELEEKIDEAL